jgi:ankyrin repeat protein
LCAVLTLSFAAAGIGPAEAGPHDSDQRLVEAAMRRDVEGVRARLTAKADVNAAQPDGTTPLHWAAHWDTYDMATLLIKAGANVNAVTDLGVPPLSLACANGSGRMVELLLGAGANPNAALPNGETMLMRCAQTGNLPAVRALLAKGADHNAKDPARGQTALMWAVAGKQSNVVRLLVEKGADVNARSKGGFTPLLFAAREGELASATMLIGAGADINAETPEKETPLIIAAASMNAISIADYNFVPLPSGHEAVAMLLIDQEASLNNADSYGRTALHFAVETRKVNLTRALLAKGANPNLQIARALPFRRGDYVGRAGHRGASPFWLAAMAADVEMMKILLEGGADPKLPSSNRTSPLMVAAGLGQTDSRMPPIDKMLEAVKFLIEIDGDVNATNAAGQGPVHGAASVSADSIIQFLADRGFKVDAKDKGGRTPFDLTQSVLRPRPDTAALLKKLASQTTGAGR